MRYNIPDITEILFILNMMPSRDISISAFVFKFEMVVMKISIAAGH